jgi:hypothetical protein
LSRHFKRNFPTFNDAVDHYAAHVKSLPADQRRLFGRRMFNRSRKQFYRDEAENPSFRYSEAERARLKGGAAPREDFQLDHLEGVGKDPTRAFEPMEVNYTRGGPRGTAPRGTPHAKKTRAVPPRKPPAKVGPSTEETRPTPVQASEPPAPEPVKPAGAEQPAPEGVKPSAVERGAAPESPMPVSRMARIRSASANAAVIGFQLVLMYFAHKLGEQEEENIKSGWKAWVAPKMQEKLASIMRDWQARPQTYPTRKTYLVVIYWLTFKKEPGSDWVPGGPVYLYQGMGYVSSFLSHSKIDKRILPSQTMVHLEQDVPELQLWASSTLIADPEADKREAERTQLRKIEERIVGPPGRREYVTPGGGRIPEW